MMQILHIFSQFLYNYMLPVISSISPVLCPAPLLHYQSAFHVFLALINGSLLYAQVPLTVPQLWGVTS